MKAHHRAGTAGRSLARDSFFFFLLIFALCLVSSPAQAWEWNARGWAMWEPAEESERLAEELLEAESVEEIETLIYETLGYIGVQVYDEMGNVVQEGDPYFADEFYLYDFQVNLLAQAFYEEQYIPLNNIIQFWGEVGLMMKNPQGIPVQSDPELIEESMRSLRHWAEEHPEDMGGFVIRLIDSLGDREEHGFDLLEEPEEEEYFDAPVGFEEMMKETALQEMEELMEYDDEFDLDEEEMVSLVEGVMSGDMSTMLGSFLSEEEMQQLKKGMAKAQEGLWGVEVEPDTPPELKSLSKSTEDLLDSFQRALGGESIEDIELSEHVLAQLKDQHEVALWREQKIINHIEEKIQKFRSQQPENAMEMMDYGSGAVVMLQRLEQEIFISDRIAQQIEYLKEYRDWAEEETKDREFLPDPPQLAEFDTEEPRSNLILDPIQSLLLQMDLIIVARDSIEQELDRLFGIFPISPRRAYAGGGSTDSLVLGTLGDGIEKFFDITTSQMLDISPAGKIMDKLNIPGKVLNIMHGLLMMLCHEISIEVDYLPEPDAQEHILEKVPGRRLMDDRFIQGIRMRSHDDERKSKIIRLRFTATFDPPDAAVRAEFGRMAAATFARVAADIGPPVPVQVALNEAASQLADLELPEPGPQSDLPVKIHLNPEIQKYAEFDPDEWHSISHDSGIVITDENGAAEVSFFPVLDSGIARVSGGEPVWVKEEGFLFRAHALTQIPESLIFTKADISDLVLSMADQMQGLTPGMGSSDRRVWIERLKPTPWKGTIWVERTIKANQNTSMPPSRLTREELESGSVNTQWESIECSYSSTWKYTLESDVFFCPEGKMIDDPISEYTVFDSQDGFTSLTFEKEGETKYHRYRRCGEGSPPVSLNKIESYKASTEDEPQGEIRVKLEFPNEVFTRISSAGHELSATYDLPPSTEWQYRVIVTPPRLPRSLSGEKTIITESCVDVDETKERIVIGPRAELDHYLDLREEFYHEIYDERWSSFEVDDKVLEGEITWNINPEKCAQSPGIKERVPLLSSLGHYPTINVTTTVRWHFERIFEEERYGTLLEWD